MRRGRIVAAVVLGVSSFGAVSVAKLPIALASSVPTSSAGCGSSNAGSTFLNPTINGVTRTVIVHYPTGVSDSTPLPLVLNLHGSGSTATDEDIFSGMDVTANENGFLVVYPQGDIPDGVGYDWNVPNEPLTDGKAVPANAPNDVSFLTQLVTLIEKDYCVNPTEVYATGFSGGGRMVSQLACDASSVFAAIAPVSGLRHPTPCPTTRSVPVISFHGSSDTVDPFNGHGLAYWTYSVPTAAKDWAKQDKCSLKATTSSPSADVELTQYRHCSGGASVELYEIAGEGHEWPGGPVMPASITGELGPQSNAINADEVMWEFFKAHSLS